MAESPKIPVTMMLPRLPDRDADLLPWAIDFSRAIRRHLERVGSGVASGAATVFGPPTISYAAVPVEGGSVAAIRKDAILPFPEALGTLANRAKTLTATDDATYSALLTAAATFGTGSAFSATASGKGLSFMAPGGTVPVCIGPNGTFGRGAYSDTDLMLHGLVTISNATRVRGWNLIGLTASGTGGATGIEMTVTDTPSGVSTQGLFGMDVTAKANNANQQGVATIIRATHSTFGGASASRGALAIFGARAATSYSANTLPSLSFFEVQQQPSLGTISGVIAALRQSTAFAIGATRRGVYCANSLESISNHVILSAAGKMFIAKDAVDGNFYGLSFQNGILMITNVGVSAPTT